MKAMLLAAGRGQRMQALTDNTPKPLLRVSGKPLIQHHIEKLSAVGITEFVINLHYQGEKIEAFLGDGSTFNVNIQYSYEEQLLGMGGGVRQALPLLGDQPFLVMSNDVWTDFPYSKLLQPLKAKAHLIVVDNPAFHREGDFSLHDDLIVDKNKTTFNYAGFGVFTAPCFQAHEPGNFGIMPVLQPLIDAGDVTGEYYSGQWFNLNTPDDLEHINKIF